MLITHFSLLHMHSDLNSIKQNPSSSSAPKYSEDPSLCTSFSQAHSNSSNLIVTIDNSKIDLAINNYLPNQTINILNGISQDYYRLRAFVKKIDGNSKFLLIAGEKHAKNSDAHSQGGKLVESFDYKALEGVNKNKYWAGDIFFKFIRFGLNIARAIGISDYEKGSTIQLAQSHDFKQGLVNLTVKAIERNNLSPAPCDNWKLINVAKVSNKILTMEDIYYMTIDNDQHVILGKEIVESAFEIVNRKIKTNENIPSTDSKHKVFLLEKNHIPSLGEQIAVAYIPILAASTLIYFLSSRILPTSLFSESIKFLTGSFVLFSVSTSMIGKELHEKFYDKKWAPYLKSVFFGAMVTSRNKTFVNSINNIFDENKEISQLLTIVGRAHVPGMADQLIHKHDWTEINIPGQKIGY